MDNYDGVDCYDAATWCRMQRVDHGAMRVLLALPLWQQYRVRAQGDLDIDNTSAALMRRIRVETEWVAIPKSPSPSYVGPRNPFSTYRGGDLRWCVENNVDEGARNIFCSLDRDVQDAIRHMGTVGGTPNPSATLMSRIRQFVSFVPLRDPNTMTARSWQTQRSYTSATRAKEIVLLFRGEPHRMGGNQDHSGGLSTDEFEATLDSYVEHLAAPLETEGYKVIVFADLKGDPDRLAQVQHALQVKFGSSLLEVRVKPYLSGNDQVGSIMSSVDVLIHWLNSRGKLFKIAGAFMLRMDVRLLSSGMEKWPTDKLCFLWKTKWAELSDGCNDVLFFIPSSLIDAFRRVLSSPRVNYNLHWMTADRELSDHVWFEFDMNHPSNTEKEQNPRYIMLGRPVGRDSFGKFTQFTLFQDMSSLAYQRAQSYTEEEMVLVWSKRVKHLMDTVSERGERFLMSEFMNVWTEAFPGECYLWYTRGRPLLKSIEICPELSRRGSTEVVWTKPGSYDAGTESNCARCQHGLERAAWRMMWKCERCTHTVCAMCGEMSGGDYVTEFLCTVCRAPWRISKRCRK